jgi:hypothetical protein
MAGETLLVSSVGTGGKTGYNETTYSYESESTFETHLCPLAIASIFEVDTAFVPRTEKAAAYDDDLIEGFESIGIDHTFSTIPKITSQNEADIVLDKLIEEVREIDPSAVVLDITHAYRSLPMVLFSAAVYLDALDEIEVDGIYYGEYQGEESPIIDLTYLHTLIEWHHALRSFQETGSLFDERKTRLFENGQPEEDEQRRNFANLTKSLNGASKHINSGLSLEAGRATRGVMDALNRVDEREFVGPESGFLSPLREGLHDLELEQDVSKTTEIELNMDELKRQREVVRFYLDRGKYWFALECARELFVNRLLLEADHGGDWLTRTARKRIETEKLSGADGRKSRQSDADAHKLWNTLSGYRNMYAHSGFNDDGIPSENKVRDIVEELCGQVDNDAIWREIL